MKSIKTNYIYSVGYQILNIILPIVTMPYISRILGSNGLGTYSYNFAIAHYFVLFIMLGINNYGNRTIAMSRNDTNNVSRNFVNIYSMQLVVGIFVSIVYVIYCLCLSSDKYVSFILLMYVLSATFDINWFFFGLEEFKTTISKNIMIKVFSTISIFVFIKTPQDIDKYCFIMAGSYLLSSLILWPFLKGKIKIQYPKWEEIKIHIRPNITLFVTVLLTSLFKIMDKIMLGMLSMVDEVGLYEASEKVINIPIAFITALGTVMLPRISNLLSSNDKSVDAYLEKSMTFAMFISSSMCFGIMAVSDIFVPMFYGDGFDKCKIIYMILLPSCLFMAFANVIRTQYLLPNKKDRDYIISASLGALTNIVLNICFIPKYGAIGASIGTLFAEFIVCLYQALATRRYINLAKLIKNNSIFILNGFFMFILVRNCNIATNPILNLACKISLGIICAFVFNYFECVFFRRIHKDDAPFDLRILLKSIIRFR